MYASFSRPSRCRPPFADFHVNSRDGTIGNFHCQRAHPSKRRILEVICERQFHWEIEIYVAHATHPTDPRENDSSMLHPLIRSKPWLAKVQRATFSPHSAVSSSPAWGNCFKADC